MPLDFNPSQGPFLLLAEMEHAKRTCNLFDAGDQQRYIELIEVLKRMSDADQGRITEALYSLARLSHSPGAAKALRGLRLPEMKREIISLIEMYPVETSTSFGGDKRKASPTLPLVLSETTDPNEIKLLAKCTRFKRPDGSRTADDILYCTHAIDALSTVRSPLAQEALLVALASDNQALFDAAHAALRRNCSDPTRTLFRELLALPRSEAIRRIARIEGKGGVAAIGASFFRASSYERFFAAAKALAG